MCNNVMFLIQFSATHRPVMYPGWSLEMPTMVRGAAGSMPPWSRDTSGAQPSSSRALHASMVGSRRLTKACFVSSTVAKYSRASCLNCKYTRLMVGGQREESEEFIPHYITYFIGQTVEYNKSYNPVMCARICRIVYTKLSDSLYCYVTLINSLYCYVTLINSLYCYATLMPP